MLSVSRNSDRESIQLESDEGTIFLIRTSMGKVFIQVINHKWPNSKALTIDRDEAEQVRAAIAEVIVGVG